MKYHQLGTTPIKVSRICLGSMTWGYQNTSLEAFEQIEYALDKGVNFIDTAEMYAVPPSAETYGKTEEIIGQWFEQTGRRNDVVLATKMVGPGVDYCRNGRGPIKEDVAKAVEGSLKRLKTEVIDLYQIHWPLRKVNSFGIRDFSDEWAAEIKTEKEDYILQILEGLQEQIDQGKLRYIGLSNETPYGIMKYLEYAEYRGMPRVQSIQNPYNLIQRQWDQHIAEVALREQCGLLAYSPLAGGVLSGKYLKGQRPEGSRYTLWGHDRMRQYKRPQTEKAIERYVTLAQEVGLTPVQLAIAFVNAKAHLTANIIGATSLTQLEEVMSAENIILSSEIIEAIEVIHDEIPNPGLRRS